MTKKQEIINILQDIYDTNLHESIKTLELRKSLLNLHFIEELIISELYEFCDTFKFDNLESLVEFYEEDQEFYELVKRLEKANEIKKEIEKNKDIIMDLIYFNNYDRDNVDILLDIKELKNKYIRNFLDGVSNESQSN